MAINNKSVESFSTSCIKVCKKNYLKIKKLTAICFDLSCMNLISDHSTVFGSLSLKDKAFSQYAP